MNTNIYVFIYTDIHLGGLDFGGFIDFGSNCYEVLLFYDISGLF